MTTDTTTPAPPETAVRTSDDLVKFRSSNDIKTSVDILAAEGKVIDTRYVGIWAYINFPNGKSHNAESIAEALNIELSFAQDAMSHFADVGCLVHDGERWFLTEMPFRAYRAGVTDVDTIREAAIKERQHLAALREESERERAERAKHPLHKPEVGTYLYIIGSPRSSFLKIGISGNVQQRLSTIQRSSPAPLEVLWQARGSYKIEQRLHEKFHKYRSHGEWFNFGDLSDPVAEIRREALRLGAVEVAV